MAYQSIPMFSEHRLATLLKASVLADINPDYVPVLHSLMECGLAMPGDCIRSLADSSAGMFIVASGHIELFDPCEHKQIARLGPGDCFGMLSLIFPGIACPDAYAIERSKFVLLNCETLHMLELSEPALAISISRSIKARLTPMMSVVSNVIMKHCI